MSKNNLFWEFIQYSGKDFENNDKAREHFKKKYGKKTINMIDNEYNKYNNFFQSKINPILNDSYDEDSEYYDNFFQHIISKGEYNFNKILNSNFNKKFHTINMGDFDIKYDIVETLFDKTNEYQHIQVFSTKNLGNVLSIDNDLQISEKDEHVYHEMMANVPINYFDKKINMLVIGGGDAGVARESLKHDNVEKVTIIELDRMVVDVTKKYFKNLEKTYENPRLDLKIYDGLKFVDEYKGPKYDIIIMDLTDFGQSNPLHTIEFYKKLINLCNEEYLICFNFDNFDKIENEYMFEKLKELKSIFKFVQPFGVFIPTFGGGYYSFCLLSNTVNPKRDINWDYYKNKKLEMNYYSPQIHITSFIFPNYLEKELKKILNYKNEQNNRETRLINTNSKINHTIINIKKINKNLLTNGETINGIINNFFKSSLLNIKNVNSNDDNYIIFNFDNGHMSLYTNYEINSLYIDLFLFEKNKSILIESINNFIKDFKKIDINIELEIKYF